MLQSICHYFRGIQNDEDTADRSSAWCAARLRAAVVKSPAIYLMRVISSASAGVGDPGALDCSDTPNEVIEDIF